LIVQEVMEIMDAMEDGLNLHLDTLKTTVSLSIPLTEMDMNKSKIPVNNSHPSTK
jgi:hypothetical protein